MYWLNTQPSREMKALIKQQRETTVSTELPSKFSILMDESLLIRSKNCHFKFLLIYLFTWCVPSKIHSSNPTHPHPPFFLHFFPRYNPHIYTQCVKWGKSKLGLITWHLQWADKLEPRHDKNKSNLITSNPVEFPRKFVTFKQLFSPQFSITRGSN